MSVQLEIQDGSPHWWLSPNVWTVPGDDPEGAMGLPVVGEPCYLWAKVHNSGKDAVTNATVRFYWANPSVGFDRTTATFVGSANVSLAGGETQDVLCLVAWVPGLVNGGHQCILAEAFHTSADPLPASPAFAVPTDRHVAQRNLSVLETAAKSSHFSMSFEIHNPERKERVFAISAKLGDISEMEQLIKQVGKQIPQGQGKLSQIGFTASRHGDAGDKSDQAAVEKLRVPGGARVVLTVAGELEGEAALLHVTQAANGKPVGGLSVLVVQADEQTLKGKE